MIDFAAFLVAVGPLALMITKLVDFVRSFDKGDTWWKGTWILLAFAFGTIYALLTAANFVNLIEGLRPEVSSQLNGTAGQIATGIAIGATASFWHEHLSATSSKQNVNLATASAEEAKVTGGM